MKMWSLAVWLLRRELRGPPTQSCNLRCTHSKADGNHSCHDDRQPVDTSSYESLATPRTKRSLRIRCCLQCALMLSFLRLSNSRNQGSPAPTCNTWQEKYTIDWLAETLGAAGLPDLVGTLNHSCHLLGCEAARAHAPTFMTNHKATANNSPFAR